MTGSLISLTSIQILLLAGQWMCFEEILRRPKQVTLRTSLLILKYYWERLKAGGEGDNRRWDGWMASLTQWTRVWANSRRRTRKPGVLQSMRLQTVRPNWVTEQEEVIWMYKETPVWTKRRDQVRRERRRPSASLGERPQRKPPLPIAQFWPSSLQNHETINSCGSRHPVCGILWGQPELSNKPP